MKDLLIQAASEIRQLRRANEILAAKVEMIDLFACVLHTRPATHSVGAAVDVAWLLDKEIAEFERVENNLKTPGEG